MTCYIIDDEKHAIDALVRYIDKSPDLFLLGSNNGVTHALTALNSSPPVDVIFLDVDMPDISGLEAVQLLPPTSCLIFTTAHSNYAYDAFQCNAIDFLLKPISFAKFAKAISKTQQHIATKQYDSLTIPGKERSLLFINPGVKGKVIQIKTSEIIYIEGLKNYVAIYTEDGKYVTYLTIGETLAALPKDSFIRIHKSFIVNLVKIRTIEGNSVIVKGNVIIPIGTSYKEPFMKMIDQATLKSKRNIA